MDKGDIDRKAHPEKDENSYKSILKGTTMFGGVQIFHLLVSLIRGKLVAMFLGPVGMGVSALYVSSTSTIHKFASMGLNLAIVKETGRVKDSEEQLRNVVGVTRMLTLLLGVAGALICVILSGLLSESSFGDTTHTIQFMSLGIMVFFGIASGGELSLLQGIRHVRLLSRATVAGSLLGLLISVPIYYFYGINGIVPAMIILAFAVWAFYFYSSRFSAGLKSAGKAWKDHKSLIIRLLAMGAILMSSDLIGSLGIYILQAFIRFFGDLDHVGLYQGANSLTLQYSGVITSAIAMDYLPRLSNAASDNLKMRGIVDRQMEIVGYLMAPIGAVLILFAPLIVRILLSGDFLSVITLLRWMGLSLVIQGLMFPLGYVAFAKDNRKVFFWLEAVGGNVVILIFSVTGYYFGGLEGLGYGILADKLIWFPVYLIINRRLYGIDLSLKAWTAIIYSLIGGVAVLAISLMLSEIVAYITGTIILIVLILYSVRKVYAMMKI